MPDLSCVHRERAAALFLRMATIRAFELRIAREAEAGHIQGPVHQSLGQEAVAAGVCANLEATDYLFSNHRGHGHALAKGADAAAMMKELFGRAGGLCGGKGGSMHVADFGAGMLGANGILADGATMGVGAAQAVELRGERRIVCVFIGDGTINRGPFLEAMNWAGVFALPVLFVIEDNGWASSTPSRRVSSGPGVCARAAAFGIPCDAVDGNDLARVDAAAARLVAEVRSMRRPRILHARTLRLAGHIARDQQLYRQAEAVLDDDDDPMVRAARQLSAAGVPLPELDSLRRQANAVIERAVEAARSAPLPDRRTAYADVQDVGGPPCPA